MPTRTRRNTVRHSILTENKTFPGAACRRRGRKDCEKMKIIKNQIHIGVETPFTILHASDTHLWRADERDGEKKMKHAKGRGVLFPQADENYEFIIRRANELGCMVAYTGDLIDFVSQANYDAARDFCRRTDCFMTAGNHEFCQFVGDGAEENAAYRNLSLADVQACFDNDIRFSCREVGGVNFVSLDNSYYRIEPEHLEALRGVVAQGKPVILLMHTPLYTDAHYQWMGANGGISYMMAAPDRLVETYPPDRYRQQIADEVTKEAYAYIRSQPTIKALLTGHMHHDYEEMFTENTVQLTVGCNTLREITVF